MEFEFELSVSDKECDRCAILEPLVKYNSMKVDDSAYLPLNVLIRRDDSGKIVGGLWGSTAYGWLSIDLLYLPGKLRKNGNGSSILSTAEAEAVQRGCHSARLDTHGFQEALGFYQKCGYSIYAELPDYPMGHARYFLKKHIE